MRSALFSGMKEKIGKCKEDAFVFLQQQLSFSGIPRSAQLQFTKIAENNVLVFE